jgi:hypothetical protein
MKVLIPGHRYLAEGVGGVPYQLVDFVLNRGLKYPGNVGEPHGGLLCQELMRILIDRAVYLNGQGPCMETENAINNLRSALAWFEARAARCRGEYIELDHADKLETEPVCKVCGHNQCSRGEAHERLPGTYR